MYADGKVEGLLHSEELAFHHHLRQPHCTLTQVVDGHKASKEEAPPPCLQEQDTLHTRTDSLSSRQCSRDIHMPMCNFVCVLRWLFPNLQDDNDKCDLNSTV